MALADYYLCDLCDAKTFYDAEVSYGENPYERQQPGGRPFKCIPVGAGDMRVICENCALTYEVIVREKAKEATGA